MNITIPEQFRDVIKMNDYLTTGRRQEFWEEPFTRRVMDAIKSKELEMKTAAEILGVSYGTLYGRYRDSYGCLKHPYRVRDFWSEPGPADVLHKLRRKEITLFRAAECLNVTVHTLATYLSTLQGSERISLSGDIGLPLGLEPLGHMGSDHDSNSDIAIDILRKYNPGHRQDPDPPGSSLTATTIKREGGGYLELPGITMLSKPSAGSVLENNPDITIVKTESIARVSKNREYKLQAAENNNAKLMSGGALSEINATSQSHGQHHTSHHQHHRHQSPGRSPQQHHHQQPHQQSNDQQAKP